MSQICFKSIEMTRKQRPQRELISQDMISKFTKNLEQISASFANPQDKSLALWELKCCSQYSSATLEPVFTSQCKQLKTDFKDANITQGLENHNIHNHIPPNTASCFFFQLGRNPWILHADRCNSTPAGPVPESSKQGNSWDTLRASRISVYHRVLWFQKRRRAMKHAHTLWMSGSISWGQHIICAPHFLPLVLKPLGWRLV